jgi:hypothetical protein
MPAAIRCGIELPGASRFEGAEQLDDFKVKSAGQATGQTSCAKPNPVFVLCFLRESVVLSNGIICTWH